MHSRQKWVEKAQESIAYPDSPFLHRGGTGLSLEPDGCSSRPRAALRNRRLRIVQVDALRFLHAHDEADVELLVQRLAELEVVAIAPIGQYPGELSSVCAGLGDQFHRQLLLGPMPLVRLGNADHIATLGILRPRQRQVPPQAEQAGLRSVAERGMHAHQAVVDLPQPPVGLAGHPGGMGSPLGDGTFVDNQTAVGMASQRGVDLAGDLGADGRRFPRRNRQEVLQSLRVASRMEPDASSM